MKLLDAAKQVLEAYDDDTCGGKLFEIRIGQLRKAVKISEPPEELPAIYYMRDNHTFKRLDEDVSKALVEIEQEFNEGYTYGMLCSKREGFLDVHASGSKKRIEFLAECKKTLEQHTMKSPGN